MRDEVSALFRELAELSPEARARYFEEHQVDPKVRAETESLLAFDKPTASLTGAVASEAKELLQPGTAGQQAAGSAWYGPYRTVGVLGEGGMGMVFLAEQTEPIRRRVALKVIKHATLGSLVARFESERQALALLDHPNIARLYDAGETADGRPWFAMEYVPGLPITSYCDTNQLGCRDRLLLFQQACRAVEHAHEKGIIHRDLKPSNILVTKIDGVAVPKVIDFGVAKAVNLRLTERTVFTEIGMLIGTPEYMSPEQTGEAEIDSTTDIYSLGVVLYELLVGATPFDTKSLRRAGYNEICRIIRETDPPRPAARLHSLGDTASEVARRRGASVASLERALHGDLEWITMKALEKEPGRRYASPSEFAADVGRQLQHEPVLARAPSAGYRLRKFARRRRLELIAAAAVFLAMVAGAATLLSSRQPPAPTDMTQHRIELPGAFFEMSQTDGRRVVYQDEWSGELRSSDGAGKVQVLLQDKFDDLVDWVVSRNFSTIALLYRGRDGQPARMAVMKTDGSGYRELWRGFGEHCHYGWWSCMLGSWSWDNRWILYYEPEEVTRRLFLVSTITGEHRELTSWQGEDIFEAPAFSPDGRFVAWEVNGREDDPQRSARILVMPVQGGAPRAVYEEASATSRTVNFIDWTADGRFLIIVSGRTGRRALHLIPVKDGAPAGEPVFIRNFADGTEPHFAYTTQTGALFFKTGKPGSFMSVHVATLDADGRLSAWRKLEINLQNSVNPTPNWSPDSKQLAYVSDDAEVGKAGSYAVHIHDVSTGQDREVYRAGDRLKCIWATRKPELVCGQSGAAEAAINAVSLDSGKIERLGIVPGIRIWIGRLSRDDRSLYFARSAREEYTLLRWNFLTGKEAVLTRREAGPNAYVDARVSPDERWIVRLDEGRLEVMPISGGTWTAVASCRSPFFDITPDSNWIYYQGADSAGQPGLFRVPITGGTPERVGDLPVQTRSGTMEISPDGRKLVFSADDSSKGFETWSLENFVPAAATR